MAVVIDELEVVPAQAFPLAQPANAAGLEPVGPSAAEQLESLLIQRAARAQRLRAD